MILRERRFWVGVGRYVRLFPLRHPAYFFVVLTAVVLVGVAKWEEASRRAYERSSEGRAEAARQEAANRADIDRQVSETMAEADLAGLKIWLRDPSSAQFAGVRSFEQSGKRITCGYVNSRNGFGGMGGAQAFAVIDFKVHLADFGPKAVKAIDEVCG